MALTKRQTAAIAVARKQLGLSDGEYRAVLFDVAGAGSTKQLDGTGFELLVSRFKRLGWQPRFRRGEFYGFRPGMASPAQVTLIRALWGEYTGDAGSDLTLGKWLRIFGVAHPRFLTAEQAPKVITALKAMAGRRADAKSAPRRGKRTTA